MSRLRSLSGYADPLLFVLLGTIWGSSYLFIKVGVEGGVPPFTLVTFRLLLGATMLGAIVAAARETLPRDLRTYLHLAVLGVLSIALPFSLIAWAEQRVDSMLASIVGAAIPLFVVVIGAFVLRAERLGPGRALGVVIGFVGVALLVGFDPARLVRGEAMAQLALVLSSISYAAGGVYARRTVRHLRPMIPAFFQLAFAFVFVGVAAFAVEAPLATSFRPEALFAIAWLGLLGSGIAYLIFFRLLGRWGAARTSTVAYVMPVVGIALGALVLREQVTATLLLGASLVIAGIVIANGPPRLALRLRAGGRDRLPEVDAPQADASQAARTA